MKAVVNWAVDLTFLGYGPGEKAVVVDGGKDDGGLGVGASPMELLLIGTGACASIDVVMILEKGRQKITDCPVEVSGKRADEPPRRFLNMHLHFIVTGENLSEDKVIRAVNLSITKYCSAAQSFAAGMPVTHDFELIGDQAS